MAVRIHQRRLYEIEEINEFVLKSMIFPPALMEELNACEMEQLENRLKPAQQLNYEIIAAKFNLVQFI